MNRYRYPTFQRPPYVSTSFEVGDRVVLTKYGIDGINEEDCEKWIGKITLVANIPGTYSNRVNVGWEHGLITVGISQLRWLRKP